jgi:serine/threonine protein kinase
MSDTPASNRPGKSSDSRKPSAQSTDSYEELAASSQAASPEDRPTVISRAPVLKSPAKRGRNPEPTLTSNGPGAYPPGSRLGHFEIRDYIGGGGMGCVYRALDVTLSRSVAVKILSHESNSDRETVRRFLNEARAAARLNHENIAQVYYVGEDDELPFIAFEYVEGMNIRDMVDRRGPLPLAEAISFTLQVAQALAHAAERQVIHRDIKPSNVLITPEGQAKVIDMGLARLQNPDDPGSDLTASGVTLGTFDYISPEQARDPRNADTRSDTYSLGCTLFYMLAGRPPFPEGTVLQKLLQHQGDEPPDIRHFRPELPEEVARVLRKMMAKDPRRRYQDSGRLIEALLSLADLAGILPHGPGRAVWVAPKQPTISLLQRHAPWMIPLAALVCMVVLLDIFWSRSNSPDHPSSREVASSSTPSQPDPATGGGNDPVTILPKAEMTDPTSDAADQSPPAGAGQDDSDSPSFETDTPFTASAEPGPADTEVPTELFRPNPVNLILAKHSIETALRQDPFAAATASAGRLSIGLSAASHTESVAANMTAAEGINGDPEEEPSTESMSTPTTDVLVVDPRSENKNRFTSLGAAVDAARPNDIIELRFNGRHEEKPLTLANRKVTVRAGKDYQPVLVFRPLEIDPVKYPRDMFNVAGGELTLGGVALELDVPRGIPADSWSLFKIGAGERVILESCSLTIRNASDQQTAHHPEVAFFRLVSSARIDMAAADEPAENGTLPEAHIRLQDCLARGEAVFLRVEDPQPIDLVWHNGLLVTTERFLVADGDERTPAPDETIQIELEHLTAVVRSGLCQFVHTKFTPRQLDTHFDCSASIFVARNAPLIEQVGILDFEQSRGQIQWKGEPNFYQGFTYFQVIRPFDPIIEPEELPLDSLEQVIWKALPEAGRPVHSTTPNDYALRGTSVTNPARSATDEDPDAGFITEDLPELPPEPAKVDTVKATGKSSRESYSRSGAFFGPTPDR